MALLAYLLLAIVLAEHWGSSRRSARAIAEAVVLTLLLVVTGQGLGFGPGVWMLAALVTLWWTLGRRVPGWQVPGLIGVALWIAVIIAVGPWLDRGEAAWAPWYLAVQGDLLSDVTFDAFVLGIVLVAFLVRPANSVVRTVLDHAGPGILAEELALKGGRVLGPLERILIFGAAVTGTFTVVAAVMAAKGLLRFPEVSRDNPHGLRAEYVLIGSFVSWALALVWVPLF